MNSKGFERNIHGELKRKIKAKGFPYLTQMNFGRDAKEMGVIQEGLEGKCYRFVHSEQNTKPTKEL